MSSLHDKNYRSMNNLCIFKKRKMKKKKSKIKNSAGNLSATLLKKKKPLAVECYVLLRPMQ